MTNFIIPGLWEHYQVNICLLALLKNHPEYFYDNVHIGAVYGNFQFCTWDGGRVFKVEQHTSKEEIEKLKYIYNEIFNVPIRFIFTNCKIKPEHCFDRFNNLVLTLCDDPINEIVINSPILQKYIEDNYPNYGLISSTTKCITDPQQLLMELNNPKYKMVCLDYNLNKNKKLLNQIDETIKPKCEFLINAICPPGCPQRKKHYELNSDFSNSYGKPYGFTGCSIEGNNLVPFMYHNNFSTEEVYEYSNNGFINFKLEGRTLPDLDVILNYVKYMIKPDYIYAVILLLINTFKDFDLNTFNESQIQTFNLF